MNSNKIIKRLGLVLAIIMCLSFVACDFGDSGNDESNNVTDGNTTSAETTDAITDDSTESESVKADTDTETDMLPENSEETSEKKDETESAEAAETDETTDAEETTEAIKDTEEATETKFSFFDEDMYEYVSFERSDYIGLEAVISNDFRVDEDDVKAYVDSVIMENRIVLNYGATMTDKPIDIADSAFIYYTGYIDGEAFSGGSNMSEKAPYELIIGSGAFIPGFEDALVGMIPGETSKEEPAQITVTFPENYGNELAGKEAIFDIWIVYSIQYDLPEYNESFITEVLEFEAKGDDVIAEYEASVVKIIEDRIAEQKEEAIESAMWESLLDNFTVIKYPEVMVQEFYNSLISEIEYYRTLYGYYGYTFETLSDFAKWYLNLAEDADWEQEVLKMAQRKVSQYMIYHGIAQAEGFTVTEEEYAKELAYYIEYYKDYGYSDEELEAALGQDSIKESVLFEEVSDLIKANITVSYAE